jgi:hypothetical protein
MAESLRSVLMRRDGLTEAEADAAVNEAREELQDRLAEGEMPFDICEELFGLEPDYLMELLC